jgi:hypothetical protein
MPRAIARPIAIATRATAHAHQIRRTPYEIARLAEVARRDVTPMHRVAIALW